MNGNCNVCDKETTAQCGKCKIAHYCSIEHLTQDFPNHKPHCIPLILAESDNLGRHWKASKDIRAGQILMKEKYIISSPYSEKVENMLCLGCGERIVKIVKCFTCGWNMCSKICVKKMAHKSECNISRKGSDLKFKILLEQRPDAVTYKYLYEYIFAIRCLKNRDSDPEMWTKIKDMKECIGKRTPDEVALAKKTFTAMKSLFKLHDFTFEDLTRVIGVIRVNSILIGNCERLAIYDKARHIAHSCMPNCFITFNQEEEVVLKASINIAKDDIIYRCYVFPLSGYYERQKCLMDVYRFKCHCLRCEDPTDLGLHSNSLTCNRCRPGLVSPPVGKQETWRCDRCERDEDPKAAVDMTKNVERLMPLISSSGACNKFLNMTKHLVSENHYNRMIAKINLVVFDWIEDEFLPEIQNEDKRIEAKLSYCRDIIRVCKIMLGGYNPVHGQISRRLLNTLAWNYQNWDGYAVRIKERILLLEELRETANDLHHIYLRDSLHEEERKTVEEADLYADMVRHCSKKFENLKLVDTEVKTTW